MRQNLTAFRPNLIAIDQDKATSIDETFQNVTVRPIIKLQNDILIAFAISYFEKYKKKDLLAADSHHREDIIRDISQKDMRFKNIIKGMIIGLFTVEELDTYFTIKAETDRRIATIVCKRLIDETGKAAALVD